MSILMCHLSAAIPWLGRADLGGVGGIELMPELDGIARVRRAEVYGHHEQHVLPGHLHFREWG